ncbi:hypothetical protein BDK51DRAFT_26340 [Blyttiomyces helicus]|uniref:Uncharacterized protein n=1 Tax=Blyttiomyces helicus TaxID=388810 RepID=A0A4P9WM63_9FUNG|nr:hypothetical protein BDK51DRAFT_26340 [Blyttiomyces helicus]|eukprot:RKO93542.1 hypothetical protein BDK51DRAFT_26340 [Blyttiomyces helicus]
MHTPRLRDNHPQPRIVNFQGGLNPNRLEVVRDSYEMLLNSNWKGCVTLKDAKARYNHLEHPSVRSGELDPDQALADFIEYWDEDVIDLIEWECYFAGVSSTIDSDAHFEKVMVGCWPGMKDRSFKPWEKLTESAKRELSRTIRKLEFIASSHHSQSKPATVRDARTFRTALDLCMLRYQPPQRSPIFTRSYLQTLANELYALAGHSLDEETFESIHYRMSRDVPAGASGLGDVEVALRTAMRKELTFMEYRIFVKTTTR